MDLMDVHCVQLESTEVEIVSKNPNVTLSEMLIYSPAFNNVRRYVTHHNEGGAIDLQGTGHLNESFSPVGLNGYDLSIK